MARINYWLLIIFSSFIFYVKYWGCIVTSECSKDVNRYKFIFACTIWIINYTPDILVKIMHLSQLFSSHNNTQGPNETNVTNCVKVVALIIKATTLTIGYISFSISKPSYAIYSPQNLPCCWLSAWQCWVILRTVNHFRELKFH